MAKKRATRGSRKEEKGKEEANVFGKGGKAREEKKLTFPELLTMWGEHQKQMLRSVTEMTAFHQQGYGSIWDGWLDFSMSTSRNLTKMAASGSKRFPEVYELWNEYSEKLTEKIQSASKKNMGEYLSGMDKWKELTDIMSRMLTQSIELKAGQEDMRELQSRYGEFSDYVSKKASERGAAVLSDFDEIQTTLLEFIGKMNDLVNEMGKEDESHEKIAAEWDAMSSQMTNEMTKMVENAVKQYTVTQEMLNGMFSTMMKSAELLFPQRKEG